MPICTRCGQENPEGFRFCGNCAAPLAADETPPRELRKTVTVVFSDVTGSTSLGEQIDPETLRQVMRQYFEAMRTGLERHGGTVEKFIGDAVMAVFGIPVLHEDDALRAVRAAVEMREALARLNTRLERERGVTIQARIGLNTGEVVAGDPSQGQSFATGDVVNVAARLEQAAGPGEILIGEGTWRLVADAVVADPVEPLSLRGKSAPVEAWLVRELLPDVPAFMRKIVSPFVGRQQELDALRGAFERATEQRRCELCTIVGPPGIGKSRVARELVTAEGEGARVVVGRCLPYGEGITFFPLAEVVRQLGGTDPRPRLEELLSGEEFADLIAERVAGAVGLAGAEGQAQETFWAFRKLFEALGRTRPLIAVIDDIHWAEPTLLDLLEYLVSFSSDAAILLVCLARPDLFDERPSWSAPRANTSLIALGPLSEDESETLIADLSGGWDLSEPARERIAEAAEGNPLFLEQMLALGAGDEDPRNLVIPPTVEALLAARIDRLPPAERAVIERASVEGRGFHRGAVSSLLPADARAGVDGVLMSLVRKEFVRPDRAAFPGQDGFRFAHMLIRDAAYQSISKELRAALHERFADWLERVAGDRLIEYEEILGYHLEQAHRYQGELGPVDEQGLALAARAAGMLGSAGRRAFARGDSPAAVNLLDRAASLLPGDDPGRVEMLPALAEAFAELGEYSRAEAVLEDAVGSAERLGDDRLLAHALVGRMLQRVRGNPDLEDIRAEAEQAVGVFEAAGDDLGLARSWRLLAYVPYLRARATETEEALLRSVHHARRAGAQREEAQSLVYLVEHGRHGDVPLEEGLRRCDEYLSRVSSRWLEAEMLVNRSQMESRLDRPEEARSTIARARAIFEEIGSEFGLIQVDDATGVLELHVGDPAAAEEHFRRTYDAMNRMGETLGATQTALPLAEVLCLQGKDEEAEELVRVIRDWAAAEDVLLQAGWRAIEGFLLARRGQLVDAERLAREAVAIADRSDWLELQAHPRVQLGQVLRLAGRPEEARSVLEEAFALYRRKGNVVGMRKTGALLEQMEEP